MIELEIIRFTMINLSASDVYPFTRWMDDGCLGFSYSRTNSRGTDTFSELGLHFLYPENWSLQSEEADAATTGVIFELPSGGFFSVETIEEEPDYDSVIQQIERHLLMNMAKLKLRIPYRSGADGRRSFNLRF